MLSDSPGSDYPLSEFIAANYLLFSRIDKLPLSCKRSFSVSPHFSILQFQIKYSLTKLLGTDKLGYNEQLGSDEICSL